MAASGGDFIRSHKHEIMQGWERSVLQYSHALASLDRGALINKVPELLDALAVWMDGGTDEANEAFAALADGHAVQRMAFGIELAILVLEYSTLRQVIFQRMAQQAPCPSRDFIRLNAGIDGAIGFSIRRYIENRDHVRDRFVAMLGHDLRNPLAAVLMTAEGLLRSESLLEDDREGIQDIVDAAQRMNRMVLDILDFARSQTTDCVPASPAACDMADICRDAVAEVQRAHPAQHIGLSLAGDLLGAFDRDRVFQALVNVLANAAQHGSEPIHLAAWEADDRRALITRVSNAGAAIPQEKVAQLFKPYVHADSESGGSLRLGLYIVAQIARSHGATYDVSSDEQETTFTIRWPRSPYDETPDRP